MPDIPFSSLKSVTDLTRDLKSIVESQFNNVMVEGEVSQPKLASSGHLYFTLKDDGAQISCVIWRSARESGRIKLEHGQQIVAAGDIQIYPPHGKYQLIVRSVQQAGVGALQLAFEKLKAKLSEEGLFNREFKNPLPRYPKSIGVVTSETSAAWHDIYSNIEKRYPLAIVKLYHAATQGVQSAPELVSGLTYFQHNPVDVIIIGRGGGSLEDLWPFNEEAVARAIFASDIPVISAVGHETDFTIADFVADIRANTPTQAAVIATPDKNDLLTGLDEIRSRIERQISSIYTDRKQLIERYKTSYVLGRLNERIQLLLERIQLNEKHITNMMTTTLTTNQHLVEQLSQKVIHLDPNKPLKMGYTRIFQREQWIKSLSSFKSEHDFEIQFKDGNKKINSPK